jgi:hypothetical protein
VSPTEIVDRYCRVDVFVSVDADDDIADLDHAVVACHCGYATSGRWDQVASRPGRVDSTVMGACEPRLLSGQVRTGRSHGSGTVDGSVPGQPHPASV